MLKPLIISTWSAFLAVLSSFKQWTLLFWWSLFGSSDVELSKEYIQTMPFSIWHGSEWPGKIFCGLSVRRWKPSNGRRAVKVDVFWQNDDRHWKWTYRTNAVSFPYENLSGWRPAPLSNSFSSANKLVMILLLRLILSEPRCRYAAVYDCGLYGFTAVKLKYHYERMQGIKR